MSWKYFHDFPPLLVCRESWWFQVRQAIETFKKSWQWKKKFVRYKFVYTRSKFEIYKFNLLNMSLFLSRGAELWCKSQKYANSRVGDHDMKMKLLIYGTTASWIWNSAVSRDRPDYIGRLSIFSEKFCQSLHAKHAKLGESF